MRVERKGKTDLGYNVLAAQHQCPHVQKAGLHFMEKNSR